MSELGDGPRDLFAIAEPGHTKVDRRLTLSFVHYCIETPETLEQVELRFPTAERVVLHPSCTTGKLSEASSVGVGGNSAECGAP